MLIKAEIIYLCKNLFDMNNGKSNSRNNNSGRSGSKSGAGKKPFGKSGNGAKKSFSKSGDGAKKSFAKSNDGKNTDEKRIQASTTNKSFDKRPKVKSTPKDSDEIRLNKYIGNSGVCSRRDADLYIASGNVKVNGVVITELGYRVKINDVVNFDGAILTPEKKTYVLLNKPKGFSSINEAVVSPENVLSLIKGASKYPLAPVGRMDKTTMGLMLFTNDTDLLQKLNTTEQRSSKLYHVSLDKNFKYEDLEKVKKGVYIDERRVFAEDVAYVEDQPKTEVGIKLKASNVKLVRAIFESLNYNVIKLDRVMYGALTKWNLPRGKWRFLTEEEVRNLKNG